MSKLILLDDDCICLVQATNGICFLRQCVLLHQIQEIVTILQLPSFLFTDAREYINDQYTFIF